MEGIWGLLFGNEPIAAVQHFFSLGHPLPFRIFSLIGDTWGMILVVGVAFWLFGREHLYATTGIVLVGAITKVLLTLIFQQTRPRGPGIAVYEHLEVSSFPSGHVYETVGPWGLLFALGCISFAMVSLMVALVSLGRLYLAAHYLGDVLGGIVFGLVLVWAYHKLWPALRSWLLRRSLMFYMAVAGVILAGALLWISLVGGHPRRYEVGGILIGAAIGLPLEGHYVQFVPSPLTPLQRALKLLVGVLGIAAFLLLDRAAPEDALLLGTATAGLATLWALLGAPLFFIRLRWAASRAHHSTRVGVHS
jgi:undecaprenyl-diphosphatase